MKLRWKKADGKSCKVKRDKIKYEMPNTIVEYINIIIVQIHKNSGQSGISKIGRNSKQSEANRKMRKCKEGKSLLVGRGKKKMYFM